MSDEKGLVVFKQGNIEITQEQKDTFVGFISAQHPTEAELLLHFDFCARKGTHPLERLIFFVKKAGRYTPITSIDYLRIRAESSGGYAGSDDAAFKGEVKKGAKSYPASATVTVWKIVSGQRCPFTGTARWAEYAPTNLDEPAAFMWKSKPYVMLAKCAEAIALRKGFPGQLQGLYIREEYEQNGAFDEFPVNASHSDKASEAIIEGETTSVEEVKSEPVRMIDWFDGSRRIAEQLLKNSKNGAESIKIFKSKFVGEGKPIKADAHLKNHLRTHFHVDTMSELTWEKFYALIDHVKNNIDDARWYAEEEKKQKTEQQAVGDKVNLDALASAWKGDGVTFRDLDAGLQERVKDMLALVDAEAIEPEDYAAMIEVLDA